MMNILVNQVNCVFPDRIDVIQSVNVTIAPMKWPVHVHSTTISGRNISSSAHERTDASRKICRVKRKTRVQRVIDATKPPAVATTSTNVRKRFAAISSVSTRSVRISAPVTSAIDCNRINTPAHYERRKSHLSSCSV